MCRTGKIVGVDCSPIILVQDLDAWAVPQEKWPRSLKIVASNGLWWEAVKTSLIVGIEQELQVSIFLAQDEGA